MRHLGSCVLACLTWNEKDQMRAAKSSRQNVKEYCSKTATTLARNGGAAAIGVRTWRNGAPGVGAEPDNTACLTYPTRVTYLSDISAMSLGGEDYRFSQQSPPR